MKKILYVLLAFLALSCGRQEPETYQPGYEAMFLVSRPGFESADTLYLKITMDEGVKKSVWLAKSSTNPEMHNIVTVSSIHEEVDILNRYKLYLELPDIFEGDKAFFAGPAIKPPVKTGESFETVSTIYGEREIKVKNRYYYSSKIYYSKGDISDTCLVIDATADSEFGVFKSVYYYSKEYGFTRFEFKGMDQKAEINMIRYGNIDIPTHGLAENLKKLLQ